VCTSRIGTVALSLSTSIDARRTRDTALIVGHLLVGDDEDDDGSHGSAAAHFPPLTRHYVSAKVCRAAVLVFHLPAVPSWNVPAPLDGSFFIASLLHSNHTLDFPSFQRRITAGSQVAGFGPHIQDPLLAERDNERLLYLIISLRRRRRLARNPYSYLGSSSQFSLLSQANPNPDRV